MQCCAVTAHGCAVTAHAPHPNAGPGTGVQGWLHVLRTCTPLCFSWQLSNCCMLLRLPLQGLALVCKGWLDALRTHTPLCLDLSKPEHLEAAALSWLGRVPIEVCEVPLGCIEPTESWPVPACGAALVWASYDGIRCCSPGVMSCCC